MNRVLIAVLITGAVLIATNPSRAEFNAWVQTYAVKKLEAEARKHGQDPNDGGAQLGGAIAGLIVSNMPIERQNFLAFSLYSVRLPEGNDAEKSCSVLAVAGQFMPMGEC